MGGVNDYADKRIEAERKLIAEWLRKNNKSSSLAIICNAIAVEIERGEYITKETGE